MTDIDECMKSLSEEDKEDFLKYCSISKQLRIEICIEERSKGYPRPRTW